MTADLHARLLAELDPTIPWDDQRDEAVYAALRAVVELHAPVERVLLRGLPSECTVTECAGCLDDGPSWPCSTIRTIAEYLGVTEGDHRAE